MAEINLIIYIHQQPSIDSDENINFKQYNPILIEVSSRKQLFSNPTPFFDDVIEAFNHFKINKGKHLRIFILFLLILLIT